ncbi:MAG TPA: ATP-binding protein [Ramlibacter sp.]|nr:ATP-binding protein [Ramlibacter sp.]
MPHSHPPPLITEHHYRQIVESAVDYAIVSFDRTGRVTTWNEGARRVLGWTAAEMQGEPVHRFFTPEDVAIGVPEEEMSLAEREGYSLDERWHMRKDGNRFWASGEVMPLMGAGGQVDGFVKILRDRTEQRLNEATLRNLNDTLRASEARLQMALDVGGMGVWQCDLRTQEVQWWPGMDAIHGMPADHPARNLSEYYELVHPDDRSRLTEVVRSAVTGKSGYTVEYRVIWPDGSIHWLEARANVLMALEGEPWGLQGVCLDITRAKRVESDLKFLAAASAELASLSDYQTTLDKIAHLAVPHFADWCAIYLIGDSGDLRPVAAAHVDPAKEITARELHRTFPHAPGQLPDGGPWKVLSTGLPVREVKVSRKRLAEDVADARQLAALLSLGLRSYLGVPLAVRGKTLGVISFVIADSGRCYTAEDEALAQDLARRAAVAIENAMLLNALQESDRAKDVFLATLAHELRNPLAPVWNGLSIIKRVPDDAVRVRQVADMIERQVGQLARLVDDLLDVSRITTGKIELKKEPTDLVSIVNSAIETSRPHIEAAHHHLSVRFQEDASTRLVADPVRLAQVFSNLLNNAAKYTRPGGQIEVDVQAGPDGLAVCVRDNGAGIAPEMLGKVFALFTQVTHPSERSQGGLGIGLSLVDGLVRLHGGTVEAHSEGLDRGSEFIVRLPRGEIDSAGEAPAAMVAGQPDPRTQGPRRVLVVDDNQDAATTLGELLKMLGGEVCLAHDGRSAVASVTEFAPDVVLLDIGLPDINGYEVARRIRQLAGVRQPRLIALTGWGQDQDKQLAAQAGFDEHWTKPVSPDRLQTLEL